MKRLGVMFGEDGAYKGTEWPRTKTLSVDDLDAVAELVRQDLSYDWRWSGYDDDPPLDAEPRNSGDIDDATETLRAIHECLDSLYDTFFPVY